MTKITSKQNRKTIWFSVLFSAIFFAALASFLIYIFIKDWPLNNHKIKTYLLPVFSFFTYYLGFSYVKNYYQKSRKIVVDKEKITIGPKVYFWKDVKRIILIGKKGFGFFSYQMEVSTLVFNDNQTLFIFDDMYSNSWEIKLFIKQIVVDRKESFEIINSRIRSNEIENENFQEFKGNPIFSFRGIMMWSLILCCIYVILLTDSKLSKFNQLKIFVPFSIFWFLLNVFSMNYFEKSKNFFVVKNHYFFWKKKIYRISDIEEIVYETQHKQANILRIITKNFKQDIYPAGTLKDRTWLEMKKELEKNGIKVRNECI